MTYQYMHRANNFELITLEISGELFHPISDESKTFLVVEDVEPYQVGDHILLKCLNDEKKYTGEWILTIVKGKLFESPGLRMGWAVVQIKTINSHVIPF